MSNKHNTTLLKIKNLRTDLKRIGQQTARVRDQLRTLTEEAEEELSTIDEAMDGLTQVIDKLSESH